MRERGKVGDGRPSWKDGSDHQKLAQLSIGSKPQLFFQSTSCSGVWISETFLWRFQLKVNKAQLATRDWTNLGVRSTERSIVQYKYIRWVGREGLVARTKMHLVRETN